jgi:tripartite-type tricarboxylate transporter receptor subunit TctC
MKINTKAAYGPILGYVYTFHAFAKFIAFTLIVACLAASIARAETYPTKTIKLLVPFVPGGTADLVGRNIAHALTESLGQSVIVENRPGAAGNIAGEVVANAAPDGYTLLLGSVSTHGINPTLYAKMPYDAVKDFAPVAIIARVSNVLVVGSEVKANSLKELIALAKAQPGKLMFASSGNGTSLHLSGEMFKMMAQVQATHVPYKGSAPALVDMMSGQIHFMFDNAPSVLPHIKSGKLRPLAVTMAQRIAQLPEVPTVAEAGLPGFEAVSWFGILAPANTPAPVVNKLNASINAALEGPLRERLIEQGLMPLTMSPAQFARHIQDEIAKWGKIVKASGATIEQ